MAEEFDDDLDLSSLNDEELTELVVNLFEDDKLCIVHDRAGDDEARIICSLGLAP